MPLWDEENETPETEEEKEVLEEEVDYEDDGEVGQYIENACWS